MRFCMDTQEWKNQRIGLLCVSLFLMFGCIGSLVWIADLDMDNLVDIIFAIISLIFAIGQFVFFFIVFTIDGRKFCLDENGITVLYFPNIKKFYPWSAFRNAVVCDFGHASKNPEYCFLIIRLAAFEEPNGPGSRNPRRNIWGMERWRSYGYTMRNFKNIIFFSYSPELLKEIRQLGDLPVVRTLTKYGEKLYAKEHPKKKIKG